MLIFAIIRTQFQSVLGGQSQRDFQCVNRVKPKAFPKQGRIGVDISSVHIL